jgi:hypothetical protein
MEPKRKAISSIASCIACSRVVSRRIWRPGSPEHSDAHLYVTVPPNLGRAAPARAARYKTLGLIRPKSKLRVSHSRTRRLSCVACTSASATTVPNPLIQRPLLASHHVAEAVRPALLYWTASVHTSTANVWNAVAVKGSRHLIETLGHLSVLARDRPDHCLHVRSVESPFHAPTLPTRLRPTEPSPRVDILATAIALEDAVRPRKFEPNRTPASHAPPHSLRTQVLTPVLETLEPFALCAAAETVHAPLRIARHGVAAG